MYAKKTIVAKNMCFEKFGAKQLGSSALKTGPNRYRKVDETWKTISARFSARKSLTLPSYDQKLINFTRIKFKSIKV